MNARTDAAINIILGIVLGLGIGSLFVTDSQFRLIVVSIQWGFILIQAVIATIAIVKMRKETKELTAAYRKTMEEFRDAVSRG